MYGLMKLLEQLTVVGQRPCGWPNTIEAYRLWVKQFLTFSAAQHQGWKQPEELGTADVEAFLNDLVVRRRLSASAPEPALYALVFLYGKVSGGRYPAGSPGEVPFARSRRAKRIPTVLSAEEVRRVIEALPEQSISRLMVELLYGTGMRVSEVCTLRVRDIDLAAGADYRPAAKGDKDRVVMLPASLQERLTAQVDGGRGTLAAGRAAGRGLCAGARCAGAQAAAGGVGAAVAVRLPLERCCGGTTAGQRHALARAIRRPGSRGRCGRPAGGDRQAGDLSHVPPQLRHPRAGGRVRHPAGAAAAGARQR